MFELDGSLWVLLVVRKYRILLYEAVKVRN